MSDYTGHLYMKFKTGIDEQENIPASGDYIVNGAGIVV